MEKKRIRGADMQKIDGLLPSTRRLPPVIHHDKKKDKKWSIGGIFKRISSIKEHSSSSNEDDIVYCKSRQNKTEISKRDDNIVLYSVKDDVLRKRNVNNLLTKRRSKTDSGQSNNRPLCCKDSFYSRGSDGSLDGAGKKIRKNKIKARVEAERDRLCGDSSSDEDIGRSNNSLNKTQQEDTSLCHSGHKQGTSSSNRRSRTARTERYIKRLNKDENVNENVDNKVLFNSYKENEIRSPVHSRFALTKVHEFNSDKIFNGIIQDNKNQSNGDFNQNNSNNQVLRDMYGNDRIYQNLDERYINTKVTLNQFESGGNQYKTQIEPPAPPPRDPRRMFAYGYYSFPLDAKHRNNKTESNLNVYNDKIAISPIGVCNIAKQYESNNAVIYPKSSIYNCTSFSEDREKSSDYGLIARRRDNVDKKTQETEAAKCIRKNNHNNQLNHNTSHYTSTFPQIKLPSSREMSRIIKNETSSSSVSNLPSKISSAPVVGHFDSVNTPNKFLSGYENLDTQRSEIRDLNSKINEDMELSERNKRSSKNLEEALFELEAIYNSLRLGDEDLLDRAEQRSLEEFNQKYGSSERISSPRLTDSPDRVKDDMAYRRLHPFKDRPASYAENTGQSSLCNISYLIASPVLSRKADPIFNFCPRPSRIGRRDEPDITRDDVVYRTINHANNTLRVLDPQPPFGIPLGPITSATDSDYLHTTPVKLETPRSPYIPQCEPDVVTDDLAFRTLRKDTSSKSASPEPKLHHQDQKKKRAVRSMSANLYGIINKDSIRLEKQTNLPKNVEDSYYTTDCNRYLNCPPTKRRVFSDGELSDRETHWQKNPFKDYDINGNHSGSDVYKQKLRVFVSPTAKDRESDSSLRISTGSISERTVEDDYSTDFRRSGSNYSPSSDVKTDVDLSAYSQLCQNLVNMIDNSDDFPNDKSSLNSYNVPSKFIENKSSVERDDKSNEGDDNSLLHIDSISSHYSGSTSRKNSIEMNDERSDDPDKLIIKLQQDIYNDATVTTEDDGLDYYLRLADENVKLIAEAFGNVADHLCENGFGKRKSSTSQSSDDNKCDAESFSKLSDSSPSRKYNLADALSKTVEDLRLVAASMEMPERNEVEAVEKRVRLDDERDCERDEEIVVAHGIERETKNETLDGASLSEGESTESEFAAVANERMRFARLSDVPFSYVTNTNANMTTTYSVVLLASLLAVLLAFLAIAS